jgi:hypothetical protein
LITCFNRLPSVRCFLLIHQRHRTLWDLRLRPEQFFTISEKIANDGGQAPEQFHSEIRIQD